MPIAFAVRLVETCRRFAWFVTFAALLGTVALGQYVATHFKMNTSVDDLLADGLAWRDLEKDLEKAFPQKLDRLVIVVDGETPDAAESAAESLAQALRAKPELFKTVVRPESIPYFRKNGLLFLSEEELTATLETLIKAQPMLGSLAKDTSLRGLFSTMGLAVEGVKRGEAPYDDLAPSFRLMSETMETVLQGQDRKLPWQSMMSSAKPKLRDLRKFILTQPVLDFTALSPGGKATQEVRRLTQELGLTPERGVSVRLTGSVALNDEEFASVAEGMELAVISSFLMVFALLYLALRSWKLILPILTVLIVGLVATTAFAMATVGSLNLISVAFAVMFLGIAVDFGIQFGVKFRDEHHREPDFAEAMRNTARLIAPPLALAAATTTLGFLAFIPTDYRGVSELGVIASAGMIIAFTLNLTLLPALLSLSKPPAEPEEIGYRWALPIDTFLLAHRRPLLGVIAALTVAGLFYATQIRFDFDPLNLKDPKTESVSTMFAIMEDPDASPYTIEILAPSLEEARTLAAKIEELPEVDHTITLASFVPEKQDDKLALIHDAKFMLDPSLYPSSPLPPPTEQEIRETFHKTAEALRSLGPDKKEAAHLAEKLEQAATTADETLTPRLHNSMISGMVFYLDRLKGLLSGESASLEAITDDLRRDWLTPDGRARVEVYPKGNARDHKILEAFTAAVRSVAPTASGAPVSIQESAKTVSSAFVKAGLLGTLAIALLSYVVLRRFTDVLRLLAPLILAGILTLGTMVIISLPLNFANIIALPLLMSLGVSYAIYFVNYWRSGRESPLSSSMARAVLFSAATTLVAFGSLWMSSHPGTQGMGQLLTIALLYSVLSTFLVLPVLLGRSR